MFQSFGELPSLFGECCSIVLHNLEHIGKVGLHHGISVICPSIDALTHRSENLLHLDGVFIHDSAEVSQISGKFRCRDFYVYNRQQALDSLLRQQILRLYAFEPFQFCLQFLYLGIACSNVLDRTARQ